MLIIGTKLKSEFSRESKSFGFSECESSFDLSIKAGTVTASKEYTDMSDAAKMHNVKKRFTHVRIAGSRFFSDQANGEFVYFTEGKKKYRGLKINST
jgi:hypothetical protein